MGLHALGKSFEVSCYAVGGVLHIALWHRKRLTTQYLSVNQLEVTAGFFCTPFPIWLSLILLRIISDCNLNNKMLQCQKLFPLVIMFLHNFVYKFKSVIKYVNFKVQPSTDMSINFVKIPRSIFVATINIKLVAS